MLKIVFNILLLLVGFTEAFPQNPLPNVIIVMADDMGYGDPRCYNKDSKIPTPTMDRLASEGMIFWDGHSASSICTPSRYAFITGKYPWRSDLVKSVSWSGYDEPLIHQDEFTIAKMMKNAGYITGIVGKWHLGINFAENTGNGYVQPKKHHHLGLQGSRNVDFTIPTSGGPNELGFDYWFGSAAGHNMEPHVFLENRFTVSVPTIWREAKSPLKPEYSASEVHEGWMAADWDELTITPTLTEKALNFIDKAHQTDQPFFLYFPHIAPHRPTNPGPQSKGKSQAGSRGDMVYELDYTIGQIMERLNQLGIEENTLVVITSDNGGTKTSDDGNDYGYRTSGSLNGYKGSLLEGGHRVPFIAYWPSMIPRNSESHALISNMDIFATLAELTATETPKDLDSQSFYPILLSPNSASPRTEFIHSLSKGAFAYRKDQWKYIQYRATKGEWVKQLYNLKEDPAESTNLIHSNPIIADSLENTLHKKLYGEEAYLVH